MSCDVYIYDDALTPVSSALIQIVENDISGVRIAIRTNAGPRTGYPGSISGRCRRHADADAEVSGVRRLIATVALVLTLLDPDPAFVERVKRWRRWLGMLGAA